MNTVTATNGTVTVDVDSVLSGPMTDPGPGTRTLTLAEVIERISQDLEYEHESPTYGVSEVVDPHPLVATIKPSTARETFVATAGTVLGQIGAKALGLTP